MSPVVDDRRGRDVEKRGGDFIRTEHNETPV